MQCLNSNNFSVQINIGIYIKIRDILLTVLSTYIDENNHSIHIFKKIKYPTLYRLTLH